MVVGNYTVRMVSRNIVEAYTQFIKQKVESLDSRYINAGVDETFQAYSSLFNLTIKDLLGMPYNLSETEQEVIDEINLAIRGTLIDTGYYRFVLNEKYVPVIFEVCQFILEKVRDDKFPNERLVNSRVYVN